MRVAQNSSRHVHYVHVWRYRMRCRITTSCMLSYFTQFAFQMVVNLVSVTCAPEDGCHTIQTSPHQHVRCQVVSRSFQGHGWLSLIHERLPVGLHRAKFHVNRWTMPGSGYIPINFQLQIIDCCLLGREFGGSLTSDLVSMVTPQAVQSYSPSNDTKFIQQVERKPEIRPFSYVAAQLLPDIITWTTKWPLCGRTCWENRILLLQLTIHSCVIPQYLGIEYTMKSWMRVAEDSFPDRHCATDADSRQIVFCHIWPKMTFKWHSNDIERSNDPKR